MSVLDAMSGCGVRCVRYLLQGEVSSVHANDADPNVMDTLSENLTSAHARGATGVSSVTNVDAHRLSPSATWTRRGTTSWTWTRSAAKTWCRRR